MPESTRGGSMSYSSYSSFIPNYPQSDFLSQLAKIASSLGQQQYQWAQDQYNNASQLTDQAVSQYLSGANAAGGLAQNNINRYENTFQPLEDSLVRDANSYASAPRIAHEMGAAESKAGQSMDANRINAERQLQSYGIDPSSGRYAELEQAQNAQRGAAQAGAGQIAQQHTEDTGRQLRGQAIQVGQQYPGQAINALNSQVQGLSGAVNAKLGTLNTGVAAMASADPFLNTAMALKYPPLGNAGSTAPQSRTSSSNNSRNGSGGPGSGGSGAGMSPYGYGGNGNPGGGGGSGGGGAGYNYPMLTGGNNGHGNGITNFDEPTSGNWGNDASPFDTYGQDVGSYTNYDPNGFGQFADTSSQAMPGGGSAFNTYGQDYGAYTNYGYGNGGSSDYSGGSSDYSGGGYNTGGQDFGSYGDTSYSSDPTAGFSSYDSGGGFGGGDNTDMGYFAAGGAVPPTTGGQVTQSMSPSGGQMQDDVPANLNEGEFVVPRDVAMWKGQEFFQKLIDQSRKARMGASAKPTAGPAQPGPARFSSQSMQG
jgi:hypothetical protein